MSLANKTKAQACVSQNFQKDIRPKSYFPRTFLKILQGIEAGFVFTKKTTIHQLNIDLKENFTGPETLLSFPKHNPEV